MISKRQEEILKIIVREYTKTAQPVGSKRILELMKKEVSTATIRNESVILEANGFLEKEHTSSGRIPSSRGYRYYVDHLMEARIDRKVFKEIENLFNDRSKSIDDVINESTKMISELTNLIAIVSKKDLKQKLKIKHIELVPLGRNSASIIFILSNGEINKKVYHLSEKDLSDLKISINLFNDNLVDSSVEDLIAKSNNVQEVIRDAIKDYDIRFQQLLKAITEEMVVKNEVYGIKNMLTNPEFSNTKKIERVLSIIENISPFDWFNFSYQNAKGQLLIDTKIGAEAASLTGEDDISLMTTDFTLNEGQINAITLIGPKRMKYEEANVLLKFLIDKINRFME